MKTTEKLNKEQLEAVQKLVDELVEKNRNKSKLFKPKEAQDFWYIDSDGDVCSTYYFNSYDGDVFKVKTGNFYRTEEEAEYRLKQWDDHSKVDARKEELNGDWCPNWEDFNSQKYFFYVETIKGNVDFGYTYSAKAEYDYKYMTEETAKQLIK